MNLQHRSYSKELLDSKNIPFEDIKRNMQELEFINCRLGGHRITLKGISKLAENKKKINVCEIGCGGGNNLAAILSWTDKKNISVNFIGIDIKKECIDFAKENTTLRNCTEWIADDYRNVTFKTNPDIIFSSLFCHHFTDEELTEQVQWMKNNCLLGFFINDLQRYWFAYYSIKILTRLFSSSYLVKNDAPLSVARGFTKKEWKNILTNACMNNYQIQWQWAFRYLVIYRK